MLASTTTPDGKTRRHTLIYVSYSRRDRKLVEQLLAVVRPLVPEAEIFYDVLIRAGDSFSETLAQRLEEASIVLFCLSPDSLQSRYCQREMEAALGQPGKRLVPIILRPCDWFGTALAKFRALPRDAKPVSTWKSRTEAFEDVARGIQAVVAPTEVVRPQAVATLPSGHTARVRRVVVSPDGTRAVSASDDGNAIVWDLATMQAAAVMRHSGPVTDVAIAPDGKTVVMAAGSAVLQGDIGSGATRMRPMPTEQPLLAIALRRDDVVAVSAVEVFRTKLQDDALVRSGVGDDHKRSFTAIGVGADGRTWVAGFSDGECQLFELDRPVATKPVAKASIVEIHPQVDSVHYVSCSADGNVQVFSFDGDLRQFPVSPFPLAGISPMPDGKCAAVAAADGVKLIDLTTGSVLRDWPLPGDPPTAVAASPDGTRIIWGTASGEVSSRSVDTTTQRPLPVGEDRLRLAYLAVLELPELWAVLESLDESALTGLGAQLQLGPEQEVLHALQSRRHGVEPPPLWIAWITSLYPSKVGKPQVPR